MSYFLCLAAAAALVTLYRFFPNKKIFIYFCGLLLLVFATSVFFSNRQTNQNFSREQIEEIRHNQQIFIDWYASYQKDIDRLDRNWQLFYNLIETLKTAEVYEYKTYEQLSELEVEVIDEQIRVHNLNAPTELDADCRNLLSEVIRKTQIYSDAQAKTVTSVRAAADPAVAKDLQELNKKIKDITLREAPAGLFTAKEISEIRDRLIVPGEGAQNEKL